MKNSTRLIKEAGVVVTKDGCAGYYTYHGINFTVKFNSEACETSWWEVNIFYDECPKVVEDYYSYSGGNSDNKWETKGDLLWDLFNFDKSLALVD